MGNKGADGFTFGCDPEVFILDKNDKPVPAALAGVPGTKLQPHPVNDGTVQVDGLAAEIGILPAKTFRDFNWRINSVLKQLREMLPEGHKIAYIPYAIFEPEIFDMAPDCDKELGCQPDFNAWTNEINPPPEFLDNPYMRSASGHLHIGWNAEGETFDLMDSQHILNCRDLVKQLDWHLGAWSTGIDTNPMRRNLYGKAGAYRPKPYGVEYRVLSNFWLADDDLMLRVWNRMNDAIRDMRDNFFPDAVSESENQRLIKAINETKFPTELARKYRYPLDSEKPSITAKKSYYAHFLQAEGAAAA